MILKSNTLTIKVTFCRDKPYIRAGKGEVRMKCPIGKCGLILEMEGLEIDGETISPKIEFGHIKEKE